MIFFEGGGIVEKVLRFASVLEEDRMSLSIVRLLGWAAIISIVVTSVEAPETLAATIGATVAVVGVVVNLAHSRYVAMRMKLSEEPRAKAD